MRFSLFF